MENLREEIEKKLNKIKELIANNEKKDKIEELRKELDNLLEKYLKEMQKQNTIANDDSSFMQAKKSGKIKE